jgi:hypothetical protein
MSLSILTKTLLHMHRAGIKAATTLLLMSISPGLHLLAGPAHLDVGRVASAISWGILADFEGLGLAQVILRVHTQHPLLGAQQAADGNRYLVIRQVPSYLVSVVVPGLSCSVVRCVVLSWRPSCCFHKHM